MDCKKALLRLKPILHWYQMKKRWFDYYSTLSNPMKEFFKVVNDTKAEDLGSWRNDSKHKRCVKVKSCQSQLYLMEFCSGKPNHDSSSY